MEIGFNVKFESRDLATLASKEGSEVFRAAISLLSSLGVPVNVEVAKPVETAKIVESVKPAETVKPVETVKPAEMVKSDVTVKPVETVKPAEVIKSDVTVKPDVTAKPAEFNRDEIMNEIRNMSAGLPDLRTVVKDELPKYGAAKMSELNDENLKRLYGKVKEHEARFISTQRGA